MYHPQSIRQVPRQIPQQSQTDDRLAQRNVPDFYPVYRFPPKCVSLDPPVKHITQPSSEYQLPDIDTLEPKIYVDSEEDTPLQEAIVNETYKRSHKSFSQETPKHQNNRSLLMH